jgi:hypothetical protein
MLRLIGQMLTAPLAVLVYSMGMLVRTVQGVQRLANQTLDGLTTGPAAPPGPDPPAARTGRGPEAARAPAWTAVGPVSPCGSMAKEDRQMKDQDLGGDDLKLVRYKIIFTKRDQERVLKEDEELVAYKTTVADFGGQKVGQFLSEAKDVAAGKPPPPSWKVGADFKIKKGDERFVKIFVEVLDHYPKEDAEYDKQTVEALRDISRKLGD